MGRVILGVTAFGHDSSACVVHDHKLVAFCEEERFSGQKHTGAYPARSVDYCLAEAGLRRQEITDVAFFLDPKRLVANYVKHNNPLAHAGKRRLFEDKRFYYELLHVLNLRSRCASLPDLVGRPDLNVSYVNHHMAHVWYAYFASQTRGFGDCVVLSNDSIGEDLSTLALAIAREPSGLTHRELLKQYDSQSLGYMYGAVTQFLGYPRGEGEGTVMALGSYGDSKFVSYFEDNITYKRTGEFEIKPGLLKRRNFRPSAQRLSDDFSARLGPPRRPDEPIEQRHCDIAYALQAVTERAVFNQVDTLSQHSDKLILTGGVAQNSVLNGKVASDYPDKHLFVPPAPHDAGCSIGAAVGLHARIFGSLPEPRDTAFLGPQYSTEEIVGLLDRCGIEYALVDDAAGVASDLVSRGKVLAVFRGRMECGPRALGNRSILANPSAQTMRERLNDQIKYREGFRPYGGIVPAGWVREVFEYRNARIDGPYMSFVYEVRPRWRKRIPSLVHVDGTCRVQIVGEGEDPFLDAFLHKFRLKTGSPVVINTSLNVKGRPIARAPEDALSTFYTSALDGVLFNERLLVTK